MSEPFDLQRFVVAQEGAYDSALAELRAGRKRGHWMWFVFPQLGVLGRSSTARYFGISGLAEGRAYLAHSVLGPRLRACSRAIAEIEGGSAEQVLGWPDNLKLRSSMTLFAHCCEDREERADFVAVLDRYYSGEEDPATVELL